MNHALKVAVLLVVTLATAAAATITIRERDTVTKTWARFCNEAYLIAQENRTREPDGTTAALDTSYAQVERLAERSPSSDVAADLRTAAPVLARPYSTGPLVLTSPLLAATTRADSALVEHCEVGRAVFDPGNLQNRPAAN